MRRVEDSLNLAVDSEQEVFVSTKQASS